MIEPFYFGKSPKLLFGVYHPPRIERTRDVGVVLCYPIGQEYIRSHRAFLQLATLLSSAGFHVLRYDYYGCGDSEGNCSKGSIGQWLDDTWRAVEELKEGCDISRTCLIGLRLGGSIATITGTKRSDIDGLVLWDPIVKGRAYIEELINSHHEWRRGSFSKPQLYPKNEKRLECLGFPLTDIMLKEIEQIDLLTLQRKPANNMLLIESSKVGDDRRFDQHLRAIGACVHSKHLPGLEVWTKRDTEVSKSLVPTQIIQCVVSWISEVFS